MRGVEHRMFGPSGHAQQPLAGGEAAGTVLQHLADAVAGDDRTQRRARLGVTPAQLRTQERIQRQPVHPHQHLTRGRDRHCVLPQLEVGRLRHPDRNPAQADGLHHGRLHGHAQNALMPVSSRPITSWCTVSVPS